MEYRVFGRTGVRVSALCLGCMTFGWRTPEAEALDLVDRARDAGINFFDTANVYGKGTSETILGKALQRTGERDRLFVATKVHQRMGDDPNAWGNSRRHILAQCEASLRRLQTDYLDLYQIHRPQPEIPIDETLRALDDLIRSGKVRYVGTSTFAAWQVVEALWASKELGLNRFVSEQPPYHLLDRRIERELLPMAQTFGLAVMPWGPLASGFLTGKYERDHAFPEGSRFAEEQAWAETHLREQAFDVVAVVRELAAEKNGTPAQLALAWTLRQPGITSPIIGPRTVAQLEENLGALEIRISDEDRERLDAVAPPGRALVSYYDARFGPHPHRW